MSGWIKLHRNISEWEWYKDHNTLILFIHLLIKANHAPKKWQGITIEAGQVLTGRKALSYETGLSEQNIRSSFVNLKSTSEVTIKSTSKYSIITIVNWNKYQDANQQPNQQLTSNQPATNHKQERKELKNDKKIRKEYTSEFQSIWNLYPRKDGSKADAFISFQKAINEGVDYGRIESGVRAYAESVRASQTEQRYVAHAATWLNQRRWESDYSAIKKPAIGRPSWTSEADKLRAKYAAEAERERQDAAYGNTAPDLRLTEGIRQDF